MAVGTATRKKAHKIAEARTVEDEIVIIGNLLKLVKEGRDLTLKNDIQGSGRVLAEIERLLPGLIQEIKVALTEQAAAGEAGKKENRIAKADNLAQKGRQVGIAEVRILETIKNQLQEMLALIEDRGGTVKNQKQLLEEVNRIKDQDKNLVKLERIKIRSERKQGIRRGTRSEIVLGLIRKETSYLGLLNQSVNEAAKLLEKNGMAAPITALLKHAIIFADDLIKIGTTEIRESEGKN